MRGKSQVPAVASQVNMHTRPQTIATLQPIACRADASEMDTAYLSLLSTPYANRAIAKPTCQKMKSHDPVSIPAPKRPVGEKAPEKVSACGITINAVKKYPLASTKSAREREIQNCPNSRTDVTKSVTKTMASRDGKNALSCARGAPANGTATAKPTSTAVITAAA